jgi:hypothetical protein
MFGTLGCDVVADAGLHHSCLTYLLFPPSYNRSELFTWCRWNHSLISNVHATPYREQDDLSTTSRKVLHSVNFAHSLMVINSLCHGITFQAR